MMPTARGIGFFGRKRERERLDAMLAQARDGQSAVLVICGEPGIGKTALLRYAARQASGMRTAEVQGIQAEMELSFAGIHRLCAPMLSGIEVLAEPQHNALRVAWGMASGDAPDRFLVAVAVLNLLSATAEKRPLLCLVDDAQWLDAASVQALGFVARRLVAEPMAMVFSLREPITTRALDGLPELSVQGLDEPDARALLSRAAPGPLDDRIRDRIIAETEGNPLALIELSQTMSRSERAGGFAPPAGGDLPSQLQDRYLRRISALPTATQRLMLLAAAEPLGDAALVWRAAEFLSLDPRALVPATEAGLLDIDARVRFHHPLVRSGVYRAASTEERRRVHDALAEVSDPELAAERRAWHRALATAEPDETVAADLERSAGRAQSRGGLPAAAALLERAASLTPDPALQASRALAAAEVRFQSGDFEATRRLLATAESGPLGGFQSACAELLHAQVAYAFSHGKDAAPLLLKAAKRIEPFDLALARRAYLTAWGAALAAGPGDGGADVMLEICHAIRALPPPAEPSQPLDLLLDGLALLTTDGRTAATPVLQRAAKAVAGMPGKDVVGWGPRVAAASSAVWDADGSSVILERQATIVRDAGALAELPIHLSALATERAWNGDLASAKLLIAESDRVAAMTGSRIQNFAALRVLTLQGKTTEASAMVETTIREAEDTGQGEGEGARMAHWAAAVLYNGLARYDDATSAARRVIANALGPWTSVWVLPELVEAAARSGNPDLARYALERLAESTEPVGNDFALGIEARSRALLTDGPAAENLYLEAIDRLGRTPRRPELARAYLLHGEWLRRADRLREARERLRTAEQMFAEIGMEAFADRARGELVAAGAKPRARHAETREELTAQEEQIARLARDGLTNTQIGAQLFLSPRTVEYHLHKVFGKLEIDSRSDLEAALPGPEPEAARS
ncbi:MAG: AAA family ATPase [Solirubrobacterales bacterium]|nr:AAA family ATPase [Solirubrobacterales bacterium]